MHSCRLISSLGVASTIIFGTDWIHSLLFCSYSTHSSIQKKIVSIEAHVSSRITADTRNFSFTLSNSCVWREDRFVGCLIFTETKWIRQCTNSLVWCYLSFPWTVSTIAALIPSTCRWVAFSQQSKHTVWQALSIQVLKVIYTRLVPIRPSLLFLTILQACMEIQSLH
jgi:hypothetical protein